MSKRIFLIILIYTGCIPSIQAQWTKKDSLRLQQILSGKEKLEMNPEALRAIRAGSFLDRDEPVSGMKINENSLPILKDFMEYLKVDTLARKVVWTDLPPAVFKLYGPPVLPELRVYLSIKKEIEAISHTFRRPSGVGFGEMFSRKIRVHKRNTKRDGTWKNYHRLSSPEVIEKRKKFLEEHPEFIIRDTIPDRKTGQPSRKNRLKKE